MLVSYFRFGAGCHQISRCRKRDKLGRAAHTPFAGPHFPRHPLPIRPQVGTRARGREGVHDRVPAVLRASGPFLPYRRRGDPHSGLPKPAASLRRAEYTAYIDAGARTKMPPHSERCTGTGSSPRVLFSPHPETPRHAASARPIERLPYCIVYSKEHRKSHDSGWMVDGFRERPRKAPYLPAGAAVRKNASEGSVSLPEYASSVKDDRSGWKRGKPPSEEREKIGPLAASPFFSWCPFGWRGGRAGRALHAH